MRPTQGVGLVARDLAPQVTDHALCTTRGARPCGRAPPSNSVLVLPQEVIDAPLGAFFFD
jgi:hypothetical protein